MQTKRYSWIITSSVLGALFISIAGSVPARAVGTTTTADKDVTELNNTVADDNDTSATTAPGVDKNAARDAARELARQQRDAARALADSNKQAIHDAKEAAEDANEKNIVAGNGTVAANQKEVEATEVEKHGGNGGVSGKGK